MKLKERIVELIKEMGIPANIKGYYYLRYAVELMYEDMSLMEAITKKFYPAIAKEFDTTASRAERAIRHAINVGWNRGNIKLQNKLFGYSVSIEKGCPTNSEFVVTLADYLHMESEGKADD